MKEAAAGLPERLTELLDTLRLIDDRSARIELLIGIADRYRGVPERIARRPYPRERLVPNCESEAYFFAEPLAGDDRFRIHFAIENPQGISARAMAVILDESCSAQPLEKLAALSTELPLEIFGNELSMGKSMGLAGMVGMVRAVARQRLRHAPPPDDHALTS